MPLKRFDFTNIGKVLAIIGGVLYLAGALPWLTAGRIMITYVLLVLISALGIITLGAKIHPAGRTKLDRIKVVGSIMLSFIGFASFKIIFRFNFGSGYFSNPDPTNLALSDPIVLGFATSIIGLILTLAMLDQSDFEGNVQVRTHQIERTQFGT